MLRYALTCATAVVLLTHSVLGFSAGSWPDPERFREAMDAFSTQDKASPPSLGAIVGIGSSSMRFWKTNDRFATDLAPLTVINRGFGGSVMHDVEVLLDEVCLLYTSPSPRD